MEPARIAELLEPFLCAPVQTIPESSDFEPVKIGGRSAVLSPGQLHHISTYIDILLRWNARINLTAIRDPEDIVSRHFGESLFAARHLFPGGRALKDGRAALGAGAAPGAGAPPGGTVAPDGRAALQGRIDGHEEVGALAPAVSTVADIGSGAGFPGLPLKLWAPNIALTLIESNHKKAAFLREVSRALTLTDVNIQNTRAESLAGAFFDTVTLRAVERFESILATATALVAPSGRLALLIGSAQEDQARSTFPSLTWFSPVPIPHSRSRILLVGSKH